MTSVPSGPYIAQIYDSSDPDVKVSDMQAAVEALQIDILTFKDQVDDTPQTMYVSDVDLYVGGGRMARSTDLANYQPVDSDLTAIAALTTTAYGRALLTLANQAALVAATGLTSNATHTGDATGATALTLATVSSSVGTFGSATQASSVTVNAKGLVTAASAITVTPAVGSITGLGTGVGTALAIAVGSVGGPVTNGGALGTPSGGNLANCTIPSSLAVNAQTVTTADITGAVGQLYVCTIAGLTANRNLTLPSASAGDRIGVYIADGDDAFSLILIGAASQTINGGSAATEWSRLFIKGELVVFRCVSANTWIVETDRRIPQKVVMQRATAKTGIAEATDTEIDGYATPTVDNAGIANATNGRITPRRGGLFSCAFRSRVNAASATPLGAGTNAILIIKANGTNDEQRFDQSLVIGLAALPIGTLTAPVSISAGSYVSAFFNVTDPTQVTTIETGNSSFNFPKLTLLEQF